MGLSTWNSPQNRESGLSLGIFFWNLAILLLTYVIPLFAEKAGMSALDTGWKPWLVLYRFSFMTAIPACMLQVLGLGAAAEFGMPAGTAGKLSLTKLENNYWNYFELSDGFVALNLTKGITETLVAEEHGVEDHRRVSRFRDAEIRVNIEPFSDQAEPTETPGRLATYRLAPIFENWESCLTRYRMSTGCLTRNPIKAWAISKSTSLCSAQRSVGCRPPKPRLEPVYRCSNEEKMVQGAETQEPITGLCGHVSSPPPAGAIDELGALLLYDAWPKISLPDATTIWLDVSPDECLNDTAACKASWSNLFIAGLVFQILTNMCILIPCYLDCKVDHKIRQARRFVEEEDRKIRLGAAAL